LKERPVYSWRVTRPSAPALQRLPADGLERFGAQARHASRFLLLVVLAGCAVPQVPARVIYEDPVNFVRLEPDPTVLAELPETRHSHPAAISTGQMAEVLKGFAVRDRRIFVQVWISGEAPLESVFNEDEIALLAPRLAEALARAKPDERVTFYLSQPQTSIKREITSGGLYVRETNLHFILGNWRIIYGIPAYGMVYDRRYPTRPTAPKGVDLFFEPADAMVRPEVPILDKLLGRERDEVVIDLRKLPVGKVLAWTDGESGTQARAATLR